MVKLFKDIRKMSTGNKVDYIKSKVGEIAADLKCLDDLVSRCTP